MAVLVERRGRSAQRLTATLGRASLRGMATTATTARTVNHVAMAYGPSPAVHAAADNVNGRPRHTLACTGRTIEAAAWDGTVDSVTCRSCRKALDTGEVEWTGR